MPLGMPGCKRLESGRSNGQKRDKTLSNLARTIIQAISCPKLKRCGRTASRRFVVLTVVQLGWDMGPANARAQTKHLCNRPRASSAGSFKFVHWHSTDEQAHNSCQISTDCEDIYDGPTPEHRVGLSIGVKVMERVHPWNILGSKEVSDASCLEDSFLLIRDA